MQVALMIVGLVSTQVPLISCSTHSAKLLFLQKVAAVVVIVGKVGGGGYAQDYLNIQENAPSPLLPQRSVQKGGRFSGAYDT